MLVPARSALCRFYEGGCRVALWDLCERVSLASAKELKWLVWYSKINLEHANKVGPTGEKTK